MKRAIILFFLALIITSCDRECEAFDKSREIAKWHMFPELASTYIFVGEGQSRVFNKIRSELSPAETIKCSTDCSCTRFFNATYDDDSFNIQTAIYYDQDDEYRPEPINYEFDYFEMKFDVTSTGEIIGMDEDSVLFNPGIDFENIDTLTIGDSYYEKVLHIMMINDEDLSDLWIARGVGLVAFEENSVRYLLE